MGEYYPGVIYIGGKITHEALDDLIDEINDLTVYVGDAYDTGSDLARDVDLKKQFEKWSETGESASFSDVDAYYGRFESLEACCRAHGLTYAALSDAHYDDDCQWVWWEPGMEEDRGCPSDNNQSELVDAMRLLDILEAPNITDVERVKNALDFIQQNTPPVVPPIQIV